MRILEACEKFVQHCESIRNLSAHTVRAYRLDLARFTACAGEQLPVSACDEATLHRYVARLFAEFDLHPASTLRHVASLRSFFRWLEDGGVIAESPFRRARIQIRRPTRLPRVLSRGELRALLMTRGRSGFAGLTARLVVELLFSTGVRVAELAALRSEDIDVQAGVITIVGKGARERRVYIPDEDVRDLLVTYRDARAPVAHDTSRFLVNSRGTSASPEFLRRLVRELGEDAHLSRRVTPHMLRHSVATYLLEEGVDIRYVQRLLGHRSIGTTEIYTHVADEALKSKVIERHPRKVITRESV